MSIDPPILPTEIDRASYREGRNDAIEECARVILAQTERALYPLTVELGRQMADAIRALKDKP